MSFYCTCYGKFKFLFKLKTTDVRVMTMFSLNYHRWHACIVPRMFLIRVTGIDDRVRLTQVQSHFISKE